MRFTKKLMLMAGLTLSLAGAPLVQAAAPSIVGTQWTLSGKFKGRASAKCQIGPAVSVPIAGPDVLTATISFDDGIIPGDNQGTFSWQDDFFSVNTITGSWEQNGSKLTLEFEHWYDSPMAVFAFALAQVPQGFDFSQSGISGSAGPLKVTKLKITGSVNRKGTKLQIAESLGFKFDAAAAGYGGANACSFQLKNLGRTYKGVPQPI